MRVLIYKRTHKGDPDSDGIFGVRDCMGSVRNWKYDAVIGIGGKSPWKQDVDIKYKINWIGLEPKRIVPTERGDRVVFAHFELYEEKGKSIKDNFPNLFEYMYGNKKRFDMSFDMPENVLIEVMEILKSVKNSAPSKAYDIENDIASDANINLNSSKCGGCLGGSQIDITIQECQK